MRAELTPFDTEPGGTRKVVLDKPIDDEISYITVHSMDDLGAAMVYLPEQVTLREQEELIALVGNVQVTWTPKEWKLFRKRMNALLKAGRLNRASTYATGDDDTP